MKDFKIKFEFGQKVQTFHGTIGTIINEESWGQSFLVQFENFKAWYCADDLTAEEND